MYRPFPDFSPPLSSRSLSSGEVSMCWIGCARMSIRLQEKKEGTDLLCIHIAICVCRAQEYVCVATNQILYQSARSLPPWSNTLLGSSSPSDSSSTSSSLRGARRGYSSRNLDPSRTLNVSGSSLAF